MKIYQVVSECYEQGGGARHFSARSAAMAAGRSCAKQGEFADVWPFHVSTKKAGVLAMLNQEKYASARIKLASFTPLDAAEARG